jgi:nucleotide-binding universal stress UspA family protein
MFKKIVWATDGSEDADRALPYAKELATRDGAELVVLHVLETFTAHHAAGLPVHPDEADLKAKVERQAAELSDAGFAVELEIFPARAPHAAHVIADAAEGAGADLIVAAARGHTKLPGFVLGSVTHRLLQIAPCPVLTVPPAARHQDRKAALAAAAAA